MDLTAWHFVSAALEKLRSLLGGWLGFHVAYLLNLRRRIPDTQVYPPRSLCAEREGDVSWRCLRKNVMDKRGRRIHGDVTKSVVCINMCGSSRF